MTFLQIQQEVRDRTRLDLGDSNLATLIQRWANHSYHEIWNRHDWPWARDREIVQTVADKTAGTVDIAAGGTTVTGTSTAFASGDVGKFIQFSNSNDWYKISAFTSATSIDIEKPYVGTSALDDGTYTIRQWFYSLSSSAEKILTGRQMQGPDHLRVVHFREFDIKKPNANSTGKPYACIVWGYDSSGNIQFTPYSYPDAIMNLEFRIKKRLTELSSDSDTPTIPTKWHYVICDGAIVRALEYARTSHEDRRAELKRADFERGISLMLTEAESDSDYHPVLQSCETGDVNYDIPRLPDDYDVR